MLLKEQPIYILKHLFVSPFHNEGGSPQRPKNRKHTGDPMVRSTPVRLESTEFGPRPGKTPCFFLEHLLNLYFSDHHYKPQKPPWGPITSWRLSRIYWEKKYPEPSQAANTITTPVIQTQMMRRVGSQVLLVAKLFYCWVSFSDGMASNKTFRMGLGCFRNSFETTNDFFSAPIPKPWPKRWGRTPSLFQSPGGRGE